MVNTVVKPSKPLSINRLDVYILHPPKNKRKVKPGYYRVTGLVRRSIASLPTSMSCMPYCFPAACMWRRSMWVRLSHEPLFQGWSSLCRLSGCRWVPEACYCTFSPLPGYPACCPGYLDILHAYTATTSRAVHCHWMQEPYGLSRCR